MAKQVTNYVCQECGYDSPQWLGKCPECGSWQSFKEIKMGPVGKSSSSGSRDYSTQINKTPKKLTEISKADYKRLSTSFEEMDGVLGGGIVRGAVMLLAGDPGIGKSTLLLQLAVAVSKTADRPVLYISGEESEEQIKLRADRITNAKDTPNFLLLSLSNTDAAVQTVIDLKPSLVIIDSIQTMESPNAGGLSGAVSQIRYAASRLIQTAKEQNIPMIIVGHVTKEGMVAGPMMLSHMVDCVLFLEGEKFTTTRILRSLKNRFGPVDEVGIFLMESEGMVEVRHPEQLFMQGLDTKSGTPGSVMVVTMEGSRAFLVELQALVVSSKLAYPRRVASGIDGRRLELLLAVLQKHCHVPVETTDVFVNIAGGLKVQDPAIDLGICLAIYSSFKNIAMRKTVGIAEVGLLGELRKVGGLDKRIREAEKLGFTTIISPQKFQSLNDVIGSLKQAT